QNAGRVLRAAVDLIKVRRSPRVELPAEHPLVKPFRASDIVCVDGKVRDIRHRRSSLDSAKCTRQRDDILALSCQCLSKLRHSRRGSPRPDGSVLVRTYPLTLPRDHTEARHTHAWDQLTYAASGVIEIDTE